MAGADEPISDSEKVRILLIFSQIFIRKVLFFLLKVWTFEIRFEIFVKFQLYQILFCKDQPHPQLIIYFT